MRMAEGKLLRTLTGSTYVHHLFENNVFVPEADSFRQQAVTEA